MSDEAMKRCPACQTVKPVSEFGKDKNRRDGRYHTCRPCVRDYYVTKEKHARKARRPELRARELYKRYGLSVEAYATMVAGQKGMCAICSQTSDKPLVVDHDHVTGKIRGLLCGRCNLGIGLFDDDPIRLWTAMSYVASPRVGRR